MVIQFTNILEIVELYISDLSVIIMIKHAYYKLYPFYKIVISNGIRLGV